MTRRRAGVLALQGDFDAHARALAALDFDVTFVRHAAELDGIGALVLPGGESTAMLRLIARAGLEDALGRALARVPVLATCAGLILAAARVTGPEQRSFGWIDVAVARNAWGRQVDSFEASADGGGPARVFIRAPRIVEVGRGVEVLATYRGEPILVREGTITAATFHPELGDDLEVHARALARRG